MSTNAPVHSAAVSGEVFDVIRALGTIQAVSMQRLSALALDTARAAMEDCLSLKSDDRRNQVGLPADVLPQTLDRAVAYSRASCAIAIDAQQEAAQLLGRRSFLPDMAVPMIADWNTVSERFTEAMRQLAEMSALNVATVP